MTWPFSSRSRPGRRSPDAAVFVGSYRKAEAVLVSVEQYEALVEASERGVVLGGSEPPQARPAACGSSLMWHRRRWDVGRPILGRCQKEHGGC